jgi:hypothetical protein
MITFVANVNALVIENCLMRQLPKAVFSQEIIRSADQQEISLIAEENESHRQQREQCETEIQGLEAALERLKGSSVYRAR